MGFLPAGQGGPLLTTPTSRYLIFLIPGPWRPRCSVAPRVPQGLCSKEAPGSFFHLPSYTPIPTRASPRDSGL